MHVRCNCSSIVSTIFPRGSRGAPPSANTAADAVAPDARRAPASPPRPWPGAPDPEYSGPVPEYETQPNEPNPFRSPAPAGPSTITTPEKRPLESNFGPGFQIQSLDEEFQLQVHIQEQIEARIWGDANNTPFKDGFYLPRQRIFFNGRITRPVEYVFSINRGFGDLNILETFINFRPTDKFMLRFGRYFTPLGYDQFAVRNLWLPTPERSLFTTNLAPNRQVGLMAWGYLFDKRLDYAAGIFTGPRNSFEDLNNAKDFNGYINARPFQDTKSLTFLRDLNVGTSVAYGRQDQPAVPLAFRVGAVAPTNSESAALATAPFLTLNRDVLERGPRLLGSVHAAHFYKGLSLIGEWQYGYGNYASPGARTSAQVPFMGYYVTASYFLTGEHVDRRAMVVPRRPLIPTFPGQRAGIGAWEAVARVSNLGFGDEVFTAGLADKNLWSNSATTTELGLNWYWNEHAKIYLFWLHGQFGEPVMYSYANMTDAVDMFWMRFQLFF
ncbi:MAG: porin [Isosphaeraceae bacterium]